MLNILIRTHGRPNGFSKLIASIREQTYKKYRIIVSIDDHSSLEYVKNEFIPENDIVEILPFDNVIVPDGFDNWGNESVTIYNQYFNYLIDKVDDGYIYCIDDDDYLADKYVLEKLMDQADENRLLLFKMKVSKLVIPNKSFGVAPMLCDIGTPCFLVHSKYAKQVKWDGLSWADGRFIINMYNIVPDTKWVDLIACIVPNSSNGKIEI